MNNNHFGDPKYTKVRGFDEIIATLDNGRNPTDSSIGFPSDISIQKGSKSQWDNKDEYNQIVFHAVEIMQLLKNYENKLNVHDVKISSSKISIK